MKLNLKDIGGFASEMIKIAGEKLIELRKEALEIQDKGGYNNFQTNADTIIEKFLADTIEARFPEHGIIGEETVLKRGNPDIDITWIIDPIDGTTNFIHNFPFYGISIGIVHKGEGIIGVVYNPSTDEIFYGKKGNGSYVNGVKLDIRKPIKLSEALVTTTMYFDDSFTHLHPGVMELYYQTRGLRMVGGASISICEIAKGTLNAYIVPSLSTWDYAAASIILKEAGGQLSQLNGKEISYQHGGSLLASYPSIHQDILNIFARFE